MNRNSRNHLGSSRGSNFWGRTGGILKRASWCTLAAVSCAALLGAVRPASACSGGTSGIFQRRVYPMNGANAVPLNAQVVVKYETSPQFSLPSRAIQIRPQGGEPIPVDAQPSEEPLTLVVRPRAVLAPQQTYEILDALTVPCSSIECGAREPRVISTFVSGTAADEVPPTFAGLVRVQSSDPGHRFCYPEPLFLLNFQWNEGSDAGSSALLYNIYDSGTSMRLASFLSGTSHTMYFTCAENHPVPVVKRWPRGPLMVRAVDWAGNEDMNETLMTAWPSCPPVQSDGAAPPDGAAPSPDGATGDVDPTDPSDGGLDASVEDTSGDDAAVADAASQEDAAAPVAGGNTRGRGCNLPGSSREFFTWTSAIGALGLALAARRRARARRHT